MRRRAFPGSARAVRATVASGGGGATILFPLAAGHSYTQRMSMQAIHPRPDSDGDVNSWERHKLQPSGIPLRFPITVQGGVRPFRYAVTSGPAGMTIGTDLYTNWATNRFQDYGVLQWASPTVGTYPITVRITDQTGATLDVTWSLSVVDKDDTSKFLWFDATNGNDSTGNGSYSTPWKTDLTKAFGSTSGSTTIQGHVILKAGSYDIPTHATNQCFLDNTSRPVVCYAIPTSITTAAAVTLNGTAGFISANYAGLFFGDLTLSGGLSTVTNWRWFQIGSGGKKRQTYWRLYFLNPAKGTLGDDGCTSVYYDTGADGTAGSYDQYVSLTSCTEENRLSGSASYGLFAFYGVKNGVVEDCYLINGANTDSLYLKDSCQNFTVACNNLDVNSRGPSSGCQNHNGGTSGNVEWVYNRSQQHGGGNAGLTWNHSGNSTNVGSHWSARNTFLGDVGISVASTVGVGPWTLENDVLQTATSPPVTSGTQVTITGSECQGTGPYVDASFNLTGTNRTNYLGIRGYEIA